MFYYGLDPTMLIILPGLILALIAQMKVSGTFAKYSKVASKRGWTAAAMAEDMLSRGGLDVVVERVAGSLSDHYDPRTGTLRLSDSVYGSTSIAALGVAAHEVGHAFQHYERYAPLGLRNAIVPAANIGSHAAVPLFILGMILSLPGLMWLGIAVFALAVVFSLISLPVELNASARALAALEQGGYLDYLEDRDAGRVLKAAAWTYVASALTAVLQLLRLLALAGVGSRRRD
ncbi:MAG: zinc metallopeptidase [Oscillospiraceae bacterium]|jgi:Zn-dependent membrane protease YugP|nr:zinc metallopeptidase [Oscillospiraceae bacterium]